MKITPRAASIALAATLAAVLSAQVPAETPKSAKSAKPAIEFSTLDSNGDGLVSTTEVQFVDDLKGSFEALDANRDDNLSPSEFAHWARAAKSAESLPASPSTGPSGSSGSQHVPSTR